MKEGEYAAIPERGVKSVTTRGEIRWTYDGAAAWWASSTTIALKLCGENLYRRPDSSRV